MSSGRVLVHLRATRPLLRRHLDVHAIEKSLKGRLVDGDVLSALGHRRRQGERAAVQALVEDAHAATVEEQNLQSVATTTVEDEQGAAARLVPDLLLRNARESIEGGAHVHGSERYENLHPRRDHRAPPIA